jgi:hypothetical protein
LKLPKLNSKHVKRIKRVLAFGLAAGILSPGAGNWMGFPALESAIFGAIIVLTSLVAALLLTYAGKGEVSDQAFDSHINDAIQNMKSQDKKDK